MRSLLIVIIFVGGFLLQLPCGQFAVSTRHVGNGYQLVIDGCAAEVLALGTAQEKEQVFPTEWEAHNWFLFMFGRMRGNFPVPLPAPDSAS